MKTKIIWANLPVRNIEDTKMFFEELGFKLNPGHNSSEELVSFLFGDDNFIIHFFKEDIFQSATLNEIPDLSKGNEILFTLSADSPEEIDEWEQKVKKAGGEIFSPTKQTPEGYGLGFSDLDKHRWNVLYRSPSDQG